MSTESKKSSLGNILKDVILGGQDGLVNVLGVVLAVAAATTDVRIVLIAGLAATFAESLSMGAVAYTSMQALKSYYKSLLSKKSDVLENDPKLGKNAVRAIYKNKGFKGTLLTQVVDHITSNKKVWLETVMTEQEHTPVDDAHTPFKSALIVGGSAFVGSFIPMIPFFILYYVPGMTFSVAVASIWAVAVSSVALFLTGVVMTKLTIGVWWQKGLEIMGVGIGAAVVGYVIGLGLGTI